MAEKPGLVWGDDGHAEGARPDGNTVALASLTPGLPGQVLGTNDDGEVVWVDGGGGAGIPAESAMALAPVMITTPYTPNLPAAWMPA